MPEDDAPRGEDLAGVVGGMSDVARLATMIAERVAQGPITPEVAAGEIRAHLSDRFDLSSPMPLDRALFEVTDMLERWTVHVTHPRYFGLFNPSVTPASVVADTLVAAYNPQLAAWSHAPAANEIERFTLGTLMERFGLDPSTGIATFTSGGAEANMTALLASLTHRLPAFPREGLIGASGRPLVFITEQSHHSVAKATQMSGLGHASVRHVESDDHGRMDPDALEGEIEAARRAGDVPCVVVATAGSTSTGVIDPLLILGGICRREQVWFHVDAAWGGAAIVSDRLRRHLAGIELADSITCDAHKWLSVPMGAGMFFCRHPQAVENVFRVHTPYMPVSASSEVHEPFSTTMQWSRRFIGLKLFLALAEQGLDGYARMIEQQADLGEYLRQRVSAAGWRVLNRTPLPVVCFTKDGIDVQGLLRKLAARQIAWMSSVPVNGHDALRACITSLRSTEKDVDAVIEALDVIAKEA